MVGKCCFAGAVAATAWKLQGDGYILFAESHGLANVRLPWLHALSFRTHESSAVLMSVHIGVQHVLVIQVGVTSVLCFVLFIMLHKLMIISRNFNAVRLLGVIIAADLSLDRHVSIVCKTCFAS